MHSDKPFLSFQLPPPSPVVNATVGEISEGSSMFGAATSPMSRVGGGSNAPHTSFLERGLVKKSVSPVVQQEQLRMFVGPPQVSEKGIPLSISDNVWSPLDDSHHHSGSQKKKETFLVPVPELSVSNFCTDGGQAEQKSTLVDLSPKQDAVLKRSSSRTSPNISPIGSNKVSPRGGFPELTPQHQAGSASFGLFSFGESFISSLTGSVANSASASPLSFHAQHARLSRSSSDFESDDERRSDISGNEELISISSGLDLKDLRGELGNFSMPPSGTIRKSPSNPSFSASLPNSFVQQSGQYLSTSEQTTLVARRKAWSTDHSPIQTYTDVPYVSSASSHPHPQAIPILKPPTSHFNHVTTSNSHYTHVYQQQQQYISQEELHSRLLAKQTAPDHRMYQSAFSGMPSHMTPSHTAAAMHPPMYGAHSAQYMHQSVQSIDPASGFSQIDNGMPRQATAAANSLYIEHPHGEHPSRTLFVRNISSSVEDEQLKELFEAYGPVRSMYTQCKHRGFVMISYYDIRHAKGAMKALQYKVINRRKIDIHYSIPKENPTEKDMNQGTLVVFNLDPSITNEELKEIFSEYGEVKEVRETPNKRHHKFVEFYDTRDADRAMKGLNKTEVKNKKIKIEPSRPGGARRPSAQSLSSTSTDPSADFEYYDETDMPSVQTSPRSGSTQQSAPVEAAVTKPATTSQSHKYTSGNNKGKVISASHAPPMDAREENTQNEKPKRHRGGQDNKNLFQLDLEKVRNGQDKRTTLMVKNIPNKYTQKMLLAAVDVKFKGLYDFFYLPIDFKNKCNVGYAFINFANPVTIIPFCEEFNNKKWEKFNSEKVCDIAYARIQGKVQLETHFANSSLMAEPDQHRPVFYSSPN